MIWALITLGIVLVWPRTEWLTDLSRPITKVEGATEKAVWLSDNRLLLLKTQRESGLGEDRKGQPLSIDWKGSVDLIDAATHTHKRLNALTELLNRTGLQSDSFRTSPDGKWVLWENTCAPEHPLPYVYVAQPDGSYSRRWIRGTLEWDLELYLDARHILQIANREPGIFVHDREYMTPQQARAILTEYALHHPLATMVETNGSDILIDCIPPDVYDITQNRPFLFSPNFSVLNMLKPTQKPTVKLPKGTTLIQGIVSPQQQSIVYSLEFTQMHPVLVWLHRFFHKVTIEPTVTEALWVSRADGHGLHEIGFVPVKLDPDSIHTEHIRHIQWLPDGKHVSFIYRGALYVTLAEPGN